MKKMYVAAVILSAFTLSGCEGMNSLSDLSSSVGKTMNSFKPEVISVKPGQICKEIEENPINAKEKYGHKTISVRGK
ncbi:TPA: hypothetical protein MB329_005053, partial [Klebsiella pneumoniae]|nr:hypothetical protein [Klebsiella pneumoniae]